MLVHPSRLFTEGLASLLKDTSYNIFHRSTGVAGASFPEDQLEGKVVFVVGGRAASEIAEMEGLVDGAPNKVIAQRLQITEATVKVHVKAILRKIRVKNRTQAAIWASKNLPLSDALASDQEGAARQVS